MEMIFGTRAFAVSNAKAKPQILKGTGDVISVDLPSNTWLAQFMRQSLRVVVVARLILMMWLLLLLSSSSSSSSSLSLLCCPF